MDVMECVLRDGRKGYVEHIGITNDLKCNQPIRLPIFLSINLPLEHSKMPWLFLKMFIGPNIICLIYGHNFSGRHGMQLKQ